MKEKMVCFLLNNANPSIRLRVKKEILNGNWVRLPRGTCCTSSRAPGTWLHNSHSFSGVFTVSCCRNKQQSHRAQDMER